jgi:hypothetical protein
MPSYDPQDVRFGSKADIEARPTIVRYSPKADMEMVMFGAVAGSLAMFAAILRASQFGARRVIPLIQSIQSDQFYTDSE